MSVYVILGILAFAIGIWIGVGAPGWPQKPDGTRSRLQKRSLNPIAWGRTPSRERQQPRAMGERRIKLR